LTLVNDAKAVALKAWSVRLAALATVFSTLEALQPLLQIFVPAGTFAIIGALFGLGTIIARFIKQDDLAAAIASVQVALDGDQA